MLTHSHSATSLYNLSQSAIMLHRVRHLTCERAWFGLVLFRYSRHFGFKNILNCCLFSRHSTINMETYPHLVSSQSLRSQNTVSSEIKFKTISSEIHTISSEIHTISSEIKTISSETKSISSEIKPISSEIRTSYSETINKI